MNLLKVKITNFGLHKSLETNLDGPVTGIIGLNGSGKSTLLEAISFALTGVLAEENSSYIHNYDKETHTGKRVSAEVELHFEVKGRTCVAKRRVTPSTTTHRLEVSGESKPRTSLSEVDEFLDEAFCTNKKAIASAVFIPQGHLDKILYGQRAEREKFLGRLLQVGNLEKIGSEIDRKEAKIASGLSDFSVSRDELETSLREAQARRDEVNVELENTADLDKHLQHSKTIQDSEEAKKTAQYELRESQNEKLRLQETLNEEVAKSPKIDSLEDVDQLWSEQKIIRAELEVAKERLKTQDRAASAQGLLRGLEEESAGLDLEEKNLTKPNPEDANLDSTLSGVETQLSRVKDLKGVLDKIPEKLKSITEVMERKKILLSQDDISRLKTLASDSQKELLAEKKLRQSLLSLVHTGDHKKCPVCDSNVSPDALSSEARSALNEEIRRLESTIRDADVKLQEDASARLTIDFENKKLTSEYGALVSDRDKIKASLRDDLPKDIEALESEKESIRERINTYNLNNRVWESFQRRRTELQRRIDALDEDTRQLAGKYNEAEHEKLREQRDSLQRKEDEIHNTLTEIDTIQKSLSVCNERIGIRTKTLEDKSKNLDAILTDKSESYKKDVLNRIEASEGVEDVIKYYDSACRERQEKVGSLRAAQEEIERIRRSLAEIERRIADMEVKRKVCEDLKSLAAAFKRDGIASRYTAHKFAQLAVLTQENLQKLNANFAVEPDMNEPVSFLFSRTDMDDGVVFPQSKLSGGQKVRLSIAFLMAVQQLIVSEVGLLVLDEPSTHLDGIGVEGIRDLLIDLTTSLRNSGCQIILCDHDPSLEMAMSRVVRLKNS